MRLLPFFLLLAVLGAAATSADEARADAARQVISRLDDGLLDLMRRADELGYVGRYDAIAPIVRQTFDLGFMARTTLGRYWQGLSEDQRGRWLRTFEAYTISNYADRFDGFSGESFAILGQKPASHDTLVVQTKLIRPGADDVSLNYRMREATAGWRVVDVYSGGKVSEVALRRSEYGAVLKSGGIEKLIDSVAAKTSQRGQP